MLWREVPLLQHIPPWPLSLLSTSVLQIEARRDYVAWFILGWRLPVLLPLFTQNEVSLIQNLVRLFYVRHL